jgi:hypothetical protein
MSTRKSTAQRVVENWPFVAGLSLIVLASVLNLYLNGKSPSDLKNLPEFLVTAYEATGMLGVSIMMGCAGVFVMLWGWFMQSVEWPRSAADKAAAENKPFELKTSPADGVALSTQQYVHPTPSDGRGRPGLEALTDEQHQPADGQPELPIRLPVQRLDCSQAFTGQHVSQFVTRPNGSDSEGSD